MITGAIWGTSRIKVYQELGLESWKSCRWFRCLCYLYKIKNYGFPGYFLKLILLDTHSCNTQLSENIATYCCRTDLQTFFLPMDYCWMEQTRFSVSQATHNVFGKHLLKSIRPLSKPMYDIHNPSRGVTSYQIEAWAQSFKWTQVQPQFWRLYKPFAYLHSRGWVNYSFLFALSLLQQYL